MESQRVRSRKKQPPKSFKGRPQPNGSTNSCSQHEDEELVFFCCKEQTLICAKCAVYFHRESDHQLIEAYKAEAMKIEQLIELQKESEQEYQEADAKRAAALKKFNAIREFLANASMIDILTLTDELFAAWDRSPPAISMEINPLGIVEQSKVPREPVKKPQHRSNTRGTRVLAGGSDSSHDYQDKSAQSSNINSTRMFASPPFPQQGKMDYNQILFEGEDSQPQFSQSFSGLDQRGSQHYTQSYNRDSDFGSKKSDFQPIHFYALFRNRRIELSMLPSDRIIELKEKIKTIEDVEIERLICGMNGVYFDDNRTITSYGIQKNDVVNVLVKRPGM